MKTLCIVPAYNEEETVGEVLEGIKKYGEEYVDKIVVVDDASENNTAEVARKHGVDVVSHIINRGYGAAQRTGHRIAMLEGYDYVLQLDGDGQHDPKYIPKFFKEMKGGDYDMILGSRWQNPSHKNFSRTRRLGINFFTKLVNFLNSSDFTDITSGYKLYKVEMLKKLSRTNDKHPAVEQMVEITRKGFKIKEISIEMPERESGESHLNPKSFLLYPLRVLKALLKVLLYR